MNIFNNGDQVALEVPRHKERVKHIMFVLGYNTQGEVICCWYDRQGDFQKADFPEGLLAKYAPLPLPPFEGNFYYSNH